MKYLILPSVLVLALLGPACSSKSSSKPAPAAQTAKQGQQFGQPSTTVQTPITTVQTPITTVQTPVVRAIGISGWWLAPTAALSNDGSDPSCSGTGCDDTHIWISSGYSCKEFLLINETQMKMITGWECWPSYNSNNKNIYFDVDQIGTITGESSTQIAYTVTGGCSASDLGAQVQNIILGTSNGSSTMIAANEDGTNQNLNKVAASSSFLQLNQQGYNVIAGCFSQTDGKTFTQQDADKATIAALSN